MSATEINKLKKQIKSYKYGGVPYHVRKFLLEKCDIWKDFPEEA